MVETLFHWDNTGTLSASELVCNTGISVLLMILQVGSRQEREVHPV